MGFLKNLYAIIEPGANLYKIEFIPFYGLSLWFYLASQGSSSCDESTSSSDCSNSWGNDIFSLWKLNAFIQLSLFTIVVQIPTFVTGLMTYVDIGWPVGLCCLAISSLVNGTGFTTRKYIACITLLIHGLRMALGALILGFPYIWKEDLSRYQHAKRRFIETTGSPKLWPMKQQHDTLMQAFANSVILAGPFILMTTNPNPKVHVVEVIGGACWFACWILENIADVQKLIFEKNAKKNNDIKTAVLGWKPYDTIPYWLWTKCRHPNYFFEWSCWNSFILMSIPSIFDFWNDEIRMFYQKLESF
mmetsp:Transcript_17286/g.20001  ORF Transcript_17286/g.20001 Transcript_17286/m.20001 type:complete len:303 (+) Transcript_17286:217-1125(+)